MAWRCVCGWFRRQCLVIGFHLLQYSVVYALCSYLCFISFLYLDLYFLVDDASMGWVSLVQTKHLFVLIHYRIKGEVGSDKHVLPSCFLLTFPRRCFFCGSFFICVSCKLCCFVFSLQPCGHLLGKG